MGTFSDVNAKDIRKGIKKNGYVFTINNYKSATLDAGLMTQKNFLHTNWLKRVNDSFIHGPSDLWDEVQTCMFWGTSSVYCCSL